MNYRNYLLQLLTCLTIVFLSQSCVEDDDFDVPVIPPIVENEILSIGGDAAIFNSCLVENFESYAGDQTNFPAYENVSTLDTRLWEVNEFSGNRYIRMSAFTANSDVVSYFVVPVNFDEADSFSFKTQDRFHNGDPLEVYIVTNYSIADNLPDATLENITSNFSISTGNTGSSTGDFVPSGDFDLSNYTGNGFIAFKYVGNGNDITTTIHIDDIQIVDNDDANCDATSGGGGGTSFDSRGGDNAVFLACESEDFEAFDDDVDEYTAYENIAYTGGRFWETDSFSGNRYLRMSAFQATGDVLSYFVVPVDFTTADNISFQTQDRFHNGDPLKVYTTTDHVIGQDIATATLTDITSSFTISTGNTGSASQPAVDSGEFSFASLTGEGFVVFEYAGSGSGTTTTMHIDNISIVDVEDAACTNGSADACSAVNFEEFADQQNDLPGYQHAATTGNLDWTVREFGGNKFIQMSAFSGNGGNGAHEAWFVMGVNFDSATGISFTSKDGFNNGDPVSVWYSTDYDEHGDPTTANWTDITSEFSIATGTSSGFADDFTPSGLYEFMGLSGNGFVAFRYEGDSTGITTTIQIDDIEVFGGTDCTFDLADVGGGSDALSVLISEIADPENESGARFLELYNYGTDAIDLSTWSLQRWTNANTDPQTPVTLSGTINAGGTFVVSNNATTFETTFGFAPDLDIGTGGPADSNGDDNIALLGPDGTIIDLFGMPGEDGTGTNHEFEDGRALRNADIMMSNATYTFSEWTIINDTGDAGTTNDPQQAPEDFTPGVHPDGGNSDALSVLISEIADPENESGARFLELFNYGTDAIDLSTWSLQRWTNANTGPQTPVTLSGTINAGETFVVSNNATTFETTFGFAPDLDIGTGGPADSNGDDNIALLGPDGTIIDLFGMPGEDGTGTNHEFEDGRALRNADIMMSNATYTFSEWTIVNDTGDAGTTNDPQQAPEDFTPGVHPN